MPAADVEYGRVSEPAGHDPTLYLGAAEHYVRGRPPYARGLAAALVDELGLDGRGRLLDAGCGPGVLALQLAGLFEQVVGLDPDAGMLAEAARLAHERGVGNARWVQGRAEQIAALAPGPYRLVTFGQSYHWTDRELVADLVHDALEPGGALVLVHHDVSTRPTPPGPDAPPIPHDAILALVDRYLGPHRRAGQGLRAIPPERHEQVLARTRLGRPRRVIVEGRADLVRDTDSVVAGYYSNSFSAPHLFGERLAAFDADLRALLAAHAPAGRFRDWPGDTELLIAVKPR
jgi:SAM-dependent methyltransferase